VNFFASLSIIFLISQIYQIRVQFYLEEYCIFVSFISEVYLKRYKEGCGAMLERFVANFRRIWQEVHRQGYEPRRIFEALRRATGRIPRWSRIPRQEERPRAGVLEVARQEALAPAALRATPLFLEFLG